MRYIKYVVALLLAAGVAGCGGSGSDTSPKLQFAALVSFGDSLSDVGTYNVGAIKALGGGKFTVNGVDNKIWIDLLAAQLHLTAPCAAQTGLEGVAAAGFNVPVVNVTACTAYGQGGARVTDPIGVNNKLSGPQGAVVGLLTVPVVTQIQQHLNTHGGKFNGNEVVTVLAGANDVFVQLANVAAGVSPATAVAAMATAGDELVALINTQIIAKGARYVVVVNVPDISTTPFGLSKDAGTQALLTNMVTTFNARLQSGLGVNPNVANVDAYTVSRDQVAHPVQYGLTNVTTPACDLSPGKNMLASSLVCNGNNLIPGVVDHYQFADTVHPTPYGYQLLAQLVAAEMAKKGWI